MPSVQILSGDADGGIVDSNSEMPCAGDLGQALYTPRLSSSPAP